MLVVPFLFSLIYAVPAVVGRIILLSIDHGYVWATSIDYGLAAGPLVVLVPILVRVRQRLLLHVVGFWLFMLTFCFVLSASSSDWGGLGRLRFSHGVPLYVDAVVSVGLFVFTVAYARRFYSRLIPFTLLALGPNLTYPLSLLRWVRRDHNLQLLNIIDLLVVAGAFLVVWGVVRLKETDGLPWRAIVLLLGDWVALTVAERALFGGLGVTLLDLGLAFYVVAWDVFHLGLTLAPAFLVVRALRRAQGPPAPLHGPRPPPVRVFQLPKVRTDWREKEVEE